MAEPAPLPPAYYATKAGGWRQWWTILHPPYTAWHLAYVAIGAALAPRVALTPLLAALGAFLLAVGIAAHAIDELHGRPLRTTLPAPALGTAAGLGLAGAAALGALGVARDGWILLPFLAAGPLLVIGYNAEPFGERLHNDTVFALAWGAFPVLTAYVAEARTLRLAPLLAAMGAVALSLAQRRLSDAARSIRRRTLRVVGTIHLVDGSSRPLDETALLQPAERALRALSWGIVLLAAALTTARLT